MIGLNKKIVELKPHDKHWKELFNETKVLLKGLLKAYEVEIEHVGSTSIEYLDAKPIIDIAIGIPNIQNIDQIKSILEKYEFIYRGDSGENGGFLFVKELETDVRTHHIHIVNKKDGQWDNYLSFRDKLNANQNLRQQYQALKKTLESKFKNDRPAYTAGKEDFIRMVLNS